MLMLCCSYLFATLYIINIHNNLMYLSLYVHVFFLFLGVISAQTKTSEDHRFLCKKGCLTSIVENHRPLPLSGTATL